MKVEFLRTGGVAGIRLTKELDTEALPSDVADRLTHLISAASFFDQPASLRSPTPGADRFQYEVTVKDGGRTKTVQVDESCVPRTLQPLIEYLTDLARTAQKMKRS